MKIFKRWNIIVPFAKTEPHTYSTFSICRMLIISLYVISL